MSLSQEENKMLEDIFDTYYDKIYCFIYVRICNKAIAEDLASQTFLKVAEKINTYNRDLGAISTWIFSIALNEIRSYFRIRKENINFDDLLELSSDADIEKSYSNDEDKMSLITLINSLDERQRSIIALKYYGNLSNKEISKILKISVTNVSTILNRTVKKLKNILLQCDEFPEYAYKEKEEKI